VCMVMKPYVAVQNVVFLGNPSSEAMENVQEAQ